MRFEILSLSDEFFEELGFFLTVALKKHPNQLKR